MLTNITFHDVDPDLLNKQRLELINLLWDSDAPRILWGLVEMLDEWYDREYDPVEE